MLDENNDQKMAKHNERCVNGGDKHSYDENDICFDCDQPKAQEEINKEQIENFFKQAFNVESAEMLRYNRGFRVKAVMKLKEKNGDFILLGLLEEVK
jgi:hypothetical protein